MILPIFGTIRNTVKMAEMDQKWQQKKKDGNVLKKEMDPQARQIQKYKEDLQQMRESRQMASIDAKLKAGGLLTPEEITYLQQKCPQKYKEYMELKNERETYKRQMESCKTKEDVEKLKMAKMNGFLAEAKSVKNNPNIPKGQKKAIMEKILRRTMGIQDEYMEFVRSGKYQALPTEEELAEETKEKAGQSGELAEDLENSEAKDPGQEEKENKIPEGNSEMEKAESLEQGKPGDEEINIKKSKKAKTDMLPDLKQAADAVFQEIEIGLKDYLKAYIP